MANRAELPGRSRPSFRWADVAGELVLVACAAALVVFACLS